MSDISLHTDSAGTVTCVSNTFIDHYMVDANGEYVKIYLYLLRCLSTNTEDFSISAIAQHLGHTDLDVKRALQYWEARNLLRLEYDWNQQLSGICLMDPITRGYSHSTPVSAVGRTVPVPPVAVPPVVVPSVAPTETVPVYNPAQISSFEQNDEVKDLLYLAEFHSHKALNAQEMNMILFWYDGLHLPADLIEYLINHCASEGHTSIYYMNKIALSWEAEGIRTLAQAEASNALHSEAYRKVVSAFGITGRNLNPTELQYLNRWTSEFGFTPDILEEACSRSILRAPKSPFKYADRILNDWHEKGVKTKADVDALDLKFTQEQINRKATWQAQSVAPKTAMSKRDRFSNFKEREDFDWDAYELKLLQKK